MLPNCITHFPFALFYLYYLLCVYFELLKYKRPKTRREQKMKNHKALTHFLSTQIWAHEQSNTPIFRMVFSFCAIGIVAWFICYMIIGSTAAPGGRLFGLVVLTVAANFGGFLVSLINLPRLIGMLATGILFQVKCSSILCIANTLEFIWLLTNSIYIGMYVWIEMEFAIKHGQKLENTPQFRIVYTLYPSLHSMNN